jgi:hypothetical protein
MRYLSVFLISVCLLVVAACDAPRKVLSAPNSPGGPDNGTPPDGNNGGGPQYVDATLTAQALAWGPFCPDHVRGDREFAGHGPHVTAHAAVDLEGNDIVLRLYFKAEEWENGAPRSDYTTAQSPYPGAANAWRRVLYTLGPNETFVRWNTSDGNDPNSSTEYVDDDHAIDSPSNTSGNGLVTRWTIMGDTSGDDVGNCTADDVYITIATNPISFVVRRPA